MSYTYKMKVRKYLPEKLYGFASCSEGSVFFHISAFKPLGKETPPPPIIGEPVEVITSDPLERTPILKALPKALEVSRLSPFTRMKGSVMFFNPKAGFGQILSEDGEYFLHRSEVLDGKLPLRGDSVSFFAVPYAEYVKFDYGKPRACHVVLEDKT